LLENVVGDLDASSGGGNVIKKNVTDRWGESTGKEVHITNAGGDIRLTEAPAGADVRTGGGDIRIRSAGKFVKASTGGGNITLNSVDGWVKASTGAGEIRVEITGDPSASDRDVTLITGLGDIELTVPKGMSMDVDIELGYTRRSRGNFKIVSDFDINEERTDEWDDRRGSPRKYIYGTGKFGSGKNKIKIRTTNGNVYLNKK
jgi:DUF4097 and DUF4098 domain-containing protein YvlB